MSDTATPPPPPPSQSSSPSHSVIMARNILTGVLTTIVGAAALYFLKFNKSGDPVDTVTEQTKQATTEAWNSLEFYENQFKEAATRSLCSGDTTFTSQNVLNDYDKIIKNIGNIEKIDHVDNLIISLIDRRLETLKDKKEATQKYYDDMSAFGDTISNDQSIRLYDGFMSKISVLDVQDSAFINAVNSKLKEKYKIDFKFMLPLEVTDEFLVGYWTYDRAKDIQLNKDNTFSWKSGDNNYRGTWFLTGLDLKFTFSIDSSSITYKITSGNKNFVVLQEPGGAGHYLCRNN